MKLPSGCLDWGAAQHSPQSQPRPLLTLPGTLGAGDFKQSLCCWWHISQEQANTIRAKNNRCSFKKIFIVHPLLAMNSPRHWGYRQKSFQRSPDPQGDSWWSITNMWFIRRWLGEGTNTTTLQSCSHPNPCEFVNASPYVAKGILQMWSS